MIQRIQTVYLILVAGLMLAILFLPLGHISHGAENQYFNVFGVHNQHTPFSIITPWTLYVLPICTAVLALITIFFYKRRKLQLNISYLTLFSIILFYTFLFMFTYIPGERYATNIHFTLATAFPAVAFILEIMAIRGIRKDEKLVRSLDRIR